MGDPGRYHGGESKVIGGGPTALTPPANVHCNVAIITVETAGFRFSVNGVDPNSGTGHLAQPGDRLTFYGDAVWRSRLIKAGEGSPVLQISYGWMELVPSYPFDLIPGGGKRSASGALVVAQELEGVFKKTYRRTFDLAGVIGVAVDISGSPTRIVKIARVQIVRPSVAQAPLIMRLSQGTYSDGTLTTVLGVAHDLGAPPGTALVRLFTGAPTALTTVDDVFDADVGANDMIYEAFGDEQKTEPITLHGVKDHFNIVLQANSQINGYIEWTERDN